MNRMILVLTVAIAMVSCQRSGQQVWQDTKSCGRHMAAGFRSLGGKQNESRQVSSRDQFAHHQEQDFIPLHEEDLYSSLVLGDIDAESAIPQSHLSPGEGNVPGIEGFAEPSAELQRLFGRIHFETDDYTIRGEENLRRVKDIADYLKRHPDIFVFVEGHCDERGAAAYNLALGARRSNAVRNQLIKNGVDLDRLFTASYGKERPLVQGHGREHWAKNRRAQFKIYHNS